jgi:hypothetical protein
VITGAARAPVLGTFFSVITAHIAAGTAARRRITAASFGAAIHGYDVEALADEV